MSTLEEIEAAIPKLNAEELAMLQQRLARARQAIVEGLLGHSVLDIPPVSVGEILRPFSSDDDLLDEMLEGRQ